MDALGCVLNDFSPDLGGRLFQEKQFGDAAPSITNTAQMELSHLI